MLLVYRDEVRMKFGAELERIIVERVTAVVHPERLVLFGSVSRGTANSDSDVDLLVLEAEVNDSRKESVMIRNALRGLGIPFDVIVMRSSWFEKTKDVVGSLAYPVHREGKIIYAA